MLKQPDTLSGYIVVSPVGAVDRKMLISSAISFEEASALSGPLLSRWEWFRFRSRLPLLREDLFGIQGPFDYPLVCRRSGPRLVILSSDRRVVEHLLNESFSP